MAQQKSGDDVTSGAGRRDEVGRTGIYPATGPYPEGAVEVITPDEINRGPKRDTDDDEADDNESDALGG
jgi:hypothetical protein